MLAECDIVIPIDLDEDELADLYERAQIAEWRTQLGEDVEQALFTRNTDLEPRDPDGANADGGADMPEHKAAGDSLTNLQEYRGYILDGGARGHAGGHRRLSFARKEVLVAADIMAGVAAMPGVGSIDTDVLTPMSAAMANSATGGGIVPYYVIDKTGTAHAQFANVAARQTYMNVTIPKRAGLEEFIHLLFADTATDRPGVGGISSTYGAIVFATVKNAQLAGPVPPPGTTLQEALARTAAHECTHLLLDEIGNAPFNALEHLNDPDPSDPPLSANDRIYLMFAQTVRQNFRAINYSDPTRRHLDLGNKESVERPEPAPGDSSAETAEMSLNP